MTGIQRFGVELRAESMNRGKGLAGHAAVFRGHAVLPGHVEALHRNAFDAALRLASTDVRALFNHDPSLLLGRQSSGTLRVGVDSEGLEFEIRELPDTQAGRDLRVLVERGDINGASFGFVPGDDVWGVAPDGRQLRTHTKIAALVDVSPVTFPAYGNASVALRAIEFGPAPVGSVAAQLIRARHLGVVGKD